MFIELAGLIDQLRLDNSELSQQLVNEQQRQEVSVSITGSRHATIPRFWGFFFSWGEKKLFGGFGLVFYFKNKPSTC